MKKHQIHPLAQVESNEIGNGTIIWQFAVVCKGAKIGEDCNINSHTFVEDGVVIGNRCTLKCGVYLWDGIELEDDVFIGPNATFVNDKYPKSRQKPPAFLKTRIKKGASIGANATILGGIEIGEGAMVGAGAVVVEDVAPGAVVYGNPARPKTRD
jgi:acetyltransferase-like isoleucine patch superfamily enzyme